MLPSPEQRDGVAAPVWDCHVHVFGEGQRYPYAGNRHYTPAVATPDDLKRHLARVHAGRVVVIQPTTYGTDNRCLLDALTALGPEARGVAVLDPAESGERELADLHARGIRGVRINTPGRVRVLEDGQALARAFAPRLQGTGWQIEVNCQPQHAGVFAEICAGHGVPLVLDHMAGIDPGAGDFVSRCRDLEALVKDSPVWIKLSGSDRVCRTQDDRKRWAGLAAALGDLMPERLIWGSDWPHTPLQQSVGTVAAFREVDVAGELGHLRGILGDSVWSLALSANPARLFR